MANTWRTVVTLILLLALLGLMGGATADLITESGEQVSEGCGTIAQLLADMWHIELC